MPVTSDDLKHLAHQCDRAAEDADRQTAADLKGLADRIRARLRAPAQPMRSSLGREERDQT